MYNNIIYMYFLTPQLLIRPDLLHHPPCRKTSHVQKGSLSCKILIYIQGVSKKLSFTELSISRFVTNIISISSQLEAGSPKAQFGKTQFFLRHPLEEAHLCLC